MWTQNLILTTKMVKNGCSGIYNYKTEKKEKKSDTQYKMNYTPITIVKWTQNLILTTKTVKSECLGI